MQRIYVSYCENESTEIVQHVFEALRARYGQARVVAGVAGRGCEKASPASVAEQVERAGLFVVLVGPEWCRCFSEPGNELLLHELECAFALDMPVIAACIEQSALPGAQELPASCQKLTQMQPFALRSEQLDQDIDALIEHIQNAVPSKPVAVGPARQQLSRYGVLAAALVGMVLLLGGFLLSSRFWLGPPPDVVGTWHAQVDYGWGVAQSEQFNFRETGGEISGNATYLGLRRIIEDATLEDEELSFFTRTREYFGNQQHMLRHEYVGQVEGDRIVFSLRTRGGPGGDSAPIEFIATRVADN